jgi:hypothetical protein
MELLEMQEPVFGKSICSVENMTYLRLVFVLLLL